MSGTDERGITGGPAGSGLGGAAEAWPGVVAIQAATYRMTVATRLKKNSSPMTWPKSLAVVEVSSSGRMTVKASLRTSKADGDGDRPHGSVVCCLV